MPGGTTHQFAGCSPKNINIPRIRLINGFHNTSDTPHDYRRPPKKIGIIKIRGPAGGHL